MPSLQTAIPLSVFFSEHSEAFSTYKLGLIARINAIYKVEKIHIYIDDVSLWREKDKVRKLFNYLWLAPYLRRKVFKKNNRDLKYVGVLPPLQLETHGSSKKEERISETRQALILRRKRGKVLLDAGLSSPIEAPISLVNRLAHYIVEGKRIVHIKIDISSASEIRVSEPKNIYYGFTVEMHDSLTSLLKSKKEKCLIIGTSRYGTPLSRIHERIAENMLSAKCLLLVFGAPRKGLREIALGEGIELEKYFDYILKTIEDQGVSVVRTEEALLASLALIDFIARASTRYIG